MRISSFIIAYALVLAILLFADRRPGPTQQGRYSHVVDLTDGQSATAPHAMAPGSRTRIIAPAALIPGTWAAGEIPPERLVAPLVVMIESNARGQPPDFSRRYRRMGIAPRHDSARAVIAIRRAGTRDNLSTTALSTTPFPVARDAAEFLMEARYTIGFAIEAPVNLTSDRTLAQQLALHGSYVVEGTARFTSLPATGSLIIVAPAKNKKPGEPPVRILAMVR